MSGAAGFWGAVGAWDTMYHRIKMLLVGPLEINCLLHAESLLIHTLVAEVLVDGLVARP